MTFAVNQWFPTSDCDPNEGRGGCDVGAREGFIENPIIMEKIKNFI
jgi:hypothetical protein